MILTNFSKYTAEFYDNHNFLTITCIFLSKFWLNMLKPSNNITSYRKQKGEITHSIESVPKVSHLWGKMDFL